MTPAPSSSDLSATSPIPSRRTRETNLRMTADVGLPVSAAIVAFGEGRHSDVIERLHPIRGYVNRFGGSHAQRDAVADVARGGTAQGQHDLARA